MINITKEFLEENYACEAGLEWWLKNCEGLPLFEQLDKIKAYNQDWVIWVISRLLCKLDPILCVRFAVFAAQLVLPIFEKEFPGDKRPRIAIEVANKYVKNPTDTDIVTALWAAAGVAARDAWDAARDARAAEAAVGVDAWVAGAAAGVAAWAAEAAGAARDAAWAARAAAETAARAAVGVAAGTAAGAAVLSKIIDYGINLLKKEVKK